MAVQLDDNIAFAQNRALTNTIRNRIVAFGPIAVALLGIAIMALAGGRDGSLMAADQALDPVTTGGVAQPMPDADAR